MGRTLCPLVVGRDRELEALERALSTLRARRGTCLVITGEAGIGKSRLARELVARAEGRAVGVGRAVPSGSSEPYRPLTEALLQLLRHTHVAPDTPTGSWGAALAPVLPMIAPPPPSGLAVSAPVRADAVLQLSRQIAPGGVVVVLEDLHWADPDTIALVEYMADHAAEEALLLAVTARDEPGSAFAGPAHRLWGHTGVVHLPLARLTADQTAQMVSACLGGAVYRHGDDQPAAARVQRSAEGVPLFVEELLASPGLPESIAETVVARLQEISAEQRRVLEAAAVLGRHFDWELLSAATGLGAKEVTGALGAGVERQLLQVDAGAFRFRHALTREAVLETMLPPQRREIAAAALDALDAAHPELPVPLRDVAVDLALKAGRRDRAGTLLYATGKWALERGAFDTSIQTLYRAVEVLDQDPSRADVQLTLVEALALAGRVDEAAEVGRTLIARGDNAESTATKRDAHLLLAQAAVSASRWATAARHLETARHLIGSDVPGVTKATMALLYSEVELADGRSEEASGLAEEALGAGDYPEVRCHAFEILGRSCRLRDLAGARSFFEQGLAVAEASGLPHWRLRALQEVGTIDMFDHVGVDRLLEARTLAEHAGAVTTAASLDLQLGACFTARWELDRSDQHARAAADLADRFRLEVVKAKALVSICANAGMRADADATEHFGRQARAAAPGDEWIRGFCLINLGMARLTGGAIDEAVGPFGEGISIINQVRHGEPASARALWPLLLARQGDRRAASALEDARRLGVSAFKLNRALLAYAEAVIAGRAGDGGRAERIVAEADPGFVNCQPWLDLARVLAVEPAIKDGWGVPGRWATSAAEQFARLGLPGLSARAAAVAASASPNPWSSSGVTEREAQVLRLVAQGWPNKEIASELRLSVRTVEKHVESLLRKTGARSRTELAVGAAGT